MEWTANIAAISAIALGAFNLTAYLVHVWAVMRANPQQLAELSKIEPPKFLRSRGPALIFFAIGATLALAPHVAEYQTNRALQRRLQYAKRWTCIDCQEVPAIGDFRADDRAPGMPVYRVAN